MKMDYGKYCDACNNVVPKDNVSPRDTSAGEGVFCKRCCGTEPDCTVCEDGVNPTDIVLLHQAAFCKECDRDVTHASRK